MKKIESEVGKGGGRECRGHCREVTKRGAFYLLDSEVDHVIQRAVLCNSDDDRLVVRRGVDAGETVGTSRETVRDVGGDDAVLGTAVHALKEREARRVGGLGLFERVEELDDDVGVSNDVALVVNSEKRKARSI